MGRPAGSDDPHQLFLDNNVALALDLNKYANRIKDISDEPNILLLALKMESTAIIIQKRTKDYRKLLKGNKKKPRR